MNSLELSLILFVSAVVFSFIWGLVTKNYSTVDRLWSLLPPAYVWIWFPNYSDNPRYIIAAVLVTLWGLRLTANFAIKGGYRFSLRKGFSGEDYRWEILREKIGSLLLYEMFNLFFISFYQLALIFLFTLPLYFLGKYTTPLNRWDALLFGLHLLLLAGETAADIGQLRFYNRRNRKPWSENRRYALGFNTFGLWRLSRHPNYFCEMGQWVVVYLYLTTASGRLHWSGFGVFLLILLFAGSTAFTEGITENKYSLYSEWKKATPPWFPLPGLLWKKRYQKAFLKGLKSKGDTAP